MKAVFDTTILLDQLNSVSDATHAINQYDGIVSTVSVIELLAAAKTPEAEKKARELLSIFEVIHTNDNISDHAVKLPRDYGLEEGEAIIYASAKHLGCLLITSNDHSFRADWEDVKIPYTAS